MRQTKDLSGPKLEAYRFENSKIFVLPYFLYEVSADKLWKNGFCNLKARYFKSNKFLKIKHKVEIKHYEGYIIIKSITLIGAPYNFIHDHNLPVYSKPVKCQKRGK